MLEAEYRSVRQAASIIPNWQTANKNDLANAYIENENNELLRNAYFAALMLRYWGNIGHYYTSSKMSGFTIEDCYSWLVESIMYVLRKRKWKDPNSPLSKDPNAPDKLMNRVIRTQRLHYYYIANCQKRRLNYNTVSYDNENIAQQDHNHILASYSPTISSSDISTISYFLYKDNKWFESFILNLLYVEDFTKVDKKTQVWSVNMASLTRCISKLNYEDFKGIMSYSSNEEDLTNKYNQLKELKPKALRSLVSKTLDVLRKNDDLKALLC